MEHYFRNNKYLGMAGRITTREYISLLLLNMQSVTKNITWSGINVFVTNRQWISHVQLGHLEGVFFIHYERGWSPSYPPTNSTPSYTPKLTSTKTLAMTGDSEANLQPYFLLFYPVDKKVLWQRKFYLFLSSTSSLQIFFYLLPLNYELIAAQISLEKR